MIGRTTNITPSNDRRPPEPCIRALTTLGVLCSLPLGGTDRYKTVLPTDLAHRPQLVDQARDLALPGRLGVETRDPRSYLREFLDFSGCGESVYKF